MSSFVLLLLLLLQHHAGAFFVDQSQLRPLKANERVVLRVEGIESWSSLLRFRYYSLPFCRPQPPSTSWEFPDLTGGGLHETSTYTLTVGRDESCLLVSCAPAEVSMDAVKLQTFEQYIEKHYRALMTLNGVPVMSWNHACGHVSHGSGYAVGVEKRCAANRTLINNHLHFHVKYFKGPEHHFDLSGFTVTPASVKHSIGGTSCHHDFNLSKAIEAPVTTDLAETKEVYWSYGVSWEEEDPRVSIRHIDGYFGDFGARPLVRWFSIGNSIFCVFLLLALKAMVLVRMVKRDVDEYNLNFVFESPDVGWMHLRPWVMQPPENAAWLVLGVSTGFQILATVICVFLRACFESEGFGVFVALYAAQSFINGYMCSRLLKRFGVRACAPVLVKTSLLAPGMLFGFLSVISTTDNSLPHAGVFAVVLLKPWLGISVPGFLTGSAFENTREGPPTGTEGPAIPRSPWYTTNLACLTLPGMLPLGILLFAIQPIATSSWKGGSAYAIGLVGLVFLLWVSSCAVTSTFVVYSRLRRGNYNWWWISFLAPSAAGLHLVAYGIYFYVTQLPNTSTPGALLYASFVSLGIMFYVVAAGAVGFLATYQFQRKLLYRMID